MVPTYYAASFLRQIHAVQSFFFFSAFETGIGIVTEVTGVEGVVSGSTTCSEISFPTPICG